MDWAAEFDRAVARLKELAPYLPDRTLPNDEDIKRRFLESVEVQKDIAFQSKLSWIKEQTGLPIEDIVSKLSTVDPRTKDVSKKNKHIPSGASAGSARGAQAGDSNADTDTSAGTSADGGDDQTTKGTSGVFLGVHYLRGDFNNLSPAQKREIHDNRDNYPPPLPRARDNPTIKKWLDTLGDGTPGSNTEQSDRKRSSSSRLNQKNWKKICSSVEANTQTNQKLTECVESVVKSVSAIDTKLDTKTNDLSTSVSAIADGLEKTLGAVGTLCGEIQNLKKGKASSSSVIATQQGAPDTSANKSKFSAALEYLESAQKQQKVSGALRRVQPFLKGGSNPNEAGD